MSKNVIDLTNRIFIRPKEIAAKGMKIMGNYILMIVISLMNILNLIGMVTTKS